MDLAQQGCKRELIIKGLGVLAEVFDRRLSEDLVNIYIKILKDCDIKDIEYAFSEALKRETKFPVPAVLFKYISDLHKPDKQKIFEKLMYYIKNYGSWYELEDVCDDMALVQAVNDIGGWKYVSLLSTKDLLRLKSQLADAYLKYQRIFLSLNKITQEVKELEGGGKDGE